MAGSVYGRATQPDDMQVTRLILKKLAVECGLIVPSHVLERGSIETVIDFATRGLRVQLQIYMAGIDSTKTVKSSRVVDVQQVPYTWWDHFKRVYAPAWFLRRWPVRYRSIDLVTHETVTTVIRKICPHIHVPDNGREHFEFFFYDAESLRTPGERQHL